MLDICKSFAESYDVLFNSSKTKMLLFGNHDEKPTVTFMGEPIDIVDHEKHLGNIIGSKKQQIHDCICTFNSKLNMIYSHFKHVDQDVLYGIFKTYCMPLYGSQLWDYNNKYVDSFYVAWRKGVRRLFNLPYNTHCNLLPYICNDLPPTFQLYRRVISFLKGLSVSHNLLSSMCYKLAMYGSCSAVSNSILVISSEWSVPRFYVPNITRDTCPVLFNSELDSRCSIICDLLQMIHLRQSRHAPSTGYLEWGVVGSPLESTFMSFGHSAGWHSWHNTTAI